MPGIKLFLFGHPRIARDNFWIEIGLRKSVALLAYLATTKQSHSRESLATLLWPHSDQRSALGNLRRAIYRVNHTLKRDLLVATRNVVEFNRHADVWIDIDDFQSHTLACLPDDRPAAGDVAALTEAVDLYTSDFLAGFTLPDSRAFDEWQYFQAENYKQTLDQILDCLVKASRDQNDWEQAIFYGRRRLALNPLDDSTHYKIIELYAQNNQRGAALRQYDEYRTLLVETLGVPPEDNVVALYESICSKKHPVSDGASYTAASSPGWEGHNGKAPSPNLSSPGGADHLPDQPQPFIGRKQELSDIYHLLVEDTNGRLITISGLSGTGKTRLAIEAAKKAALAFEDGVYFIPLTSITSPRGISAEIAEQMLGPLQEGMDHHQRLLNFLNNKSTLLILDSFEHLLPAARILSEILAAAPRVKLLVTSTERLKLKTESVYVLEGIDYPPETSEVDVLSYGAVQLFIQQAHLTRPQIEICPSDYQQIARICRLVKGMPIAIILAAGWIDVLTCKEIAEEITKNIDFLRSQLHDLPERQLSLRGVFEHSWDGLSSMEREAFMRLSVSRGGFTRRAAIQFAGADLHTLRSLIDKSLVLIKKGGHYDIHNLLRHYAEEKLIASGQMETTCSAHSDYYLKFLSQRTALLKGRGLGAALSEIEVDFENIRAAWSWALLLKNWSGISQALENLYLFCDIRGCWKEGAKLLKDAQQALAPEPGERPSLVYGKITLRLEMLQSRYLHDCPFVPDTIRQGLEIVQEYRSEPDIAVGLLALDYPAGGNDGKRPLTSSPSKTSLSFQ